MFRLSKPRTEFFGHANLDSQMIPDSQQERQVAQHEFRARGQHTLFKTLLVCRLD